MIVIAPIFWIGNTHRRFLQKCQKTCSNLKLGSPIVKGRSPATHLLRPILYAANAKNNAVTPMTYTNINGIVTDKSPRHRSNPISTLKDSTMVDGAPMNVSSSAVCARDPLNNAAI